MNTAETLSTIKRTLANLCAEKEGIEQSIRAKTEERDRTILEWLASVVGLSADALTAKRSSDPRRHVALHFYYKTFGVTMAHTARLFRASESNVSRLNTRTDWNQEEQALLAQLHRTWKNL